MKKLYFIISFLSAILYFSQSSPIIEWQKTLGGNLDETPQSIQPTADGGYIAIGYSNSNNGNVSGNHGKNDYWIVKLNNWGLIQWEKSFGGSGNDYGTAIQQTNDGGYIIAGYSYSNDGDISNHHGDENSADYWIIKIDSTGNIKWQKSFGGSSHEFATDIRQTNDGGYVIAGYSQSNDGDVSNHHGDINLADYWIVKIDDIGNIKWQKSLGGSRNEEAYSISQTIDGGYIVAGYGTSTDGDMNNGQGSPDYWIVKLNPNGIIEWQKSFGGSDIDNARSIQQTNDEGYIISGSSRSIDGDVTGNHGSPIFRDYWIVKLDKNGNILWQKSLGGSKDDYAYSICQTADNGYITIGKSYSNDGDVSGNHGYSNDSYYFYDFWVVKLDSNGNMKWQKSLGGSSGDEGYSIKQTGDGGYILAGQTASTDGDLTGNNGGYDFWVVKLSAENLETKETKLNSILAYPNPTKDNLTFSEEISDIKITDLSGKIIKQISSSEKSINVSKLAKGNYIIFATTKTGETINKKFIKE